MLQRKIMQERGILHFQCEEGWGRGRVTVNMAVRRLLADKIFRQIPEQGERASNGTA